MATTPLSTNTHGAGGHDDHSSHISSTGLLVGVLLLLMGLMGVTIWASFIDIPSIGPIPGIVMNNLVALAIATVKAALVIWFFMGVRFASSLAKIWVAAGFLVLFLMFGIMGDYGTRKFEPVQGWEVGTPVDGGETSLPRTWPPEGRTPGSPAIEQNLRPR